MLELPKSFYLLGLKRKDSASHLHRLREARLSYSDMNQVRVNKHTDKYRENQCLVSWLDPVSIGPVVLDPKSQSVSGRRKAKLTQEKGEKLRNLLFGLEASPVARKFDGEG